MNRILSYCGNYIKMIFTDATIPDSSLPEPIKKITKKLIEMDTEAQKPNPDIKITTRICHELFSISYGKGVVIEKFKYGKRQRNENLASNSRKCSYCGLTYGELSHLFQHIRRKHFHFIEQKVSILIFKHLNTISNTFKIILIHYDIQYL